VIEAVDAGLIRRQFVGENSKDQDSRKADGQFVCGAEVGFAS
jgi:hypothetical protein